MSKLVINDDFSSLLITPSTTYELDVYEGCCLAVIKIDFFAFMFPVRYRYIGFPQKVFASMDTFYGIFYIYCLSFVSVYGIASEKYTVSRGLISQQNCKL